MPSDCDTSAGPCSFIHCRVGIDTRMPFHEVPPKQVWTTPCEFTAVNTQCSLVLLALVSRESLRLCIIKIANAARVPDLADSRLLSWYQSLLDPVKPLR